jgi:hypothetical protein
MLGGALQMKESPLIRAAHNGHLHTVRHLLEAGADANALDLVRQPEAMLAHVACTACKGSDSGALQQLIGGPYKRIGCPGYPWAGCYCHSTRGRGAAWEAPTSMTHLRPALEQITTTRHPAAVRLTIRVLPNCTNQTCPAVGGLRRPARSPQSL